MRSRIHTASNAVRNQLGVLTKTGFFHIFGASSLNRVLIVILGFVLVRVLSKEDYGVYAYAFNIASFFVIFNGLGVTSAILQICSELHADKEAADSIYSYGYRWGIGVDLTMAVVIVFVGVFVPLKIHESNSLLILYCIYPLVMFLFDVKAVRFRVLLMNNVYAFGMNMQSILMTALSILGALLFSAVGLVVGQILSYAITYVVLCIRHPFSKEGVHALAKREKRDFWSISLISSVNNGLSQALTLTGTFFIGCYLTNDALVAEYQVATMIPFGLMFLPGMFMTYVYPYFARNKEDRRWSIGAFAKLSAACFVLMGVVSALVCWFAEPIVLLLFGSQYAEIVPILRILMIGFFIAGVLRQPSGNLLVTQRKLLTNTAIGIITIAVNVAASVFLIPGNGMYGAAYTYLITMGSSGVLYAVCYIRTLLRLPKSSQAQSSETEEAGEADDFFKH